MNEQQPREIHEIKCTCRSCGNVWFYGKQEVERNQLAATHNTGAALGDCGKSMMCCGGCIPALFIPSSPRRTMIDLDKCPKCGSAAVVKEEIVHNV